MSEDRGDRNKGGSGNKRDQPIHQGKNNCL